MPDNNSTIRVKDNRMFNPDGSPREPVADESGSTPSRESKKPSSSPTQADSTKTPPSEPKPASAPKTKPEPSAPEEAYNSHAGVYPEQIDFQTFILSLASSAQISMGVVPNPITGRVSRELAHAKQTIDILGILEKKTLNNLNPEESGLLKNILFQLRMQFVELSKNEKRVS